MSSGLTTKEAIDRLIQLFAHAKIPHTNFKWTWTALFQLPLHEFLLLSTYILSIGMIFIAAVLHWNASCSLGDIVLLLTLLLLSSFTLWLIRRRLREPGCCTTVALDKLLSDLVSENDNPLIYPEFDIPPHLSSVLQSTIRDDKLISVPTMLLVPGDVIIIKPGQVFPAFCSSDAAEQDLNDISHPELLPGNSGHSTIHVLQKPIKAVVTEAPFVYFLRQFEESQCRITMRSDSPLSNFIQLFLMTTFIIKWIILFLFSTTLLTQTWVINSTTWLSSDPLLFSCIAGTLGRFLFCLSGLGLSLLWLFSLSLVSFRAERVIFHPEKHLPSERDSSPSSSIPSSRLSIISLASNVYEALPNGPFDRRDLQVNICTIWSKFCTAPDPIREQQLLILGAISSVCCVNQEGILSRPIPSPEKIFFFHRRRRHRHHHSHHNHNQLHQEQSFASRYGTKRFSSGLHDEIFRSPRSPLALRDAANSKSVKPLPEFPSLTKQFFGTNMIHHRLQRDNAITQSEVRSDRMGSFCSELEDQGIMHGTGNPQVVPMVLDLRTDNYWPYLPHFEKPRWVRFLSSLKPIGLSLLLNNCHSSVAQERAAVANHLTCYNAENRSANRLLPFTPLPFCLCGLARQIGFQASASNGFVSCGCIGAYHFGCSAYSAMPVQIPLENHPVPERASAVDHLGLGFSSKQGLSSNPTSSMSSCFAAVFRDTSPTGNYQLLSQGTGDMLSSLCSDLWDGRDVVPMHYAEQCSLLDFYNRNASAAFCVGFAYAPLLERPALAHPSPTESGLPDNPSVVLLQLPKLDYSVPLPSPLDRVRTSSHRLHRPYSAQIPRPTTAPAWRQSLISGSTELQDKHRSWHIEPQFVFHGLDQPSGSPATPHDLVASSDIMSKEEEETLLELVWPAHNAPAPNTSGSCSSTHITQSSTDLQIDPNHQLPPAVQTRHVTDDLPSSKKQCTYVQQEQESRFSPSNLATPTELQAMIENQIFLGLISMQYQVNASVVETIRRLGQACIRFVHFSRENELRSRVFAERLGLECGWNCHISLASPEPSNVANSSPQQNHRVSVERPNSVSHREELSINESATTYYSTSRLPWKGILGRSGSLPLTLPSTVNKHRTIRHAPSAATVVPLMETLGAGLTFYEQHSFNYPSPRDTIPHDTLSEQSSVDHEDQNNNNKRNNLSPHSGDGSSSSGDSTSVTSAEDGSRRRERNGDLRLSDYLTQNKSRLPCGIENIRPHLEHVDNVPLQVSLFTDCTPTTTYQMITILQEYGEIVCTVGSCLSIDNIQPLASGDIAILMRPILPQPCNVFADHVSNDPPPVLSLSCPQTPFHNRTQKRRKRFFHRSKSNVSESIALDEHGKRMYDNPRQPMDSLDLSCRIMNLLFPWVLDMNIHGFRIYPLIHEVRASVNNLYLLLTFAVLAPMSATLLQWLLLLVGLLSLPVVASPYSPTDHSNFSAPTSDRVAVLWLPVERLRMHLVPISDAQLQLQPWMNLTEVVRHNHLTAKSGYGAGQLIWLILFVVPALSLSLLDRQVERTRPLREPPSKRGKPVDRKKCIRAAVTTSLRFIPSILVCTACGLSYFMFAPGFESCQQMLNGSDNLTMVNWTESLKAMVMSSNVSIVEVPECFIRLSVLIGLVGDVVFFQFILYLVIISFVYANYGQRIWKFRCSTNPSWCASALTILFLHSTYLAIRICYWVDFPQLRPWDFLSLGVFSAGLIWCPVLVGINELVAWKERRLIMAEHRLARLYFGTKLGMYSPV